MSWTLHHGSSLAGQGMASLPDKSIDHVITDAPYSSYIYDKARTLKGKREHSTGHPRRHEFKYEPLTDVERAFACLEIARLCRRWALVFTDVESLHLWRAELEPLGMLYVRCGAWIRLGGAPQITGDRPAAGFEAVAIFHAGGKALRWNGRGSPGIWPFPIVHASDRARRDHTTPKPLPLMRELVRLFTEPGDLICDPFAGSATTGVAAVELGRSFVGWEKDQKFFRRARLRLEGTREQLDLFGPRAHRRRPRPKQARFPTISTRKSA